MASPFNATYNRINQYELRVFNSPNDKFNKSADLALSIMVLMLSIVALGSFIYHLKTSFNVINSAQIALLTLLSIITLFTLFPVGYKCTTIINEVEPLPMNISIPNQ